MGLALLWAGGAGWGLLAAPHLETLARLIPRCAWHVWSGVPCPTCGATRAALALARGELAAAISFNPLATIGMIVLVLGLGAPLWVSARGPIPRFSMPDSGAWRAAAWLAMAGQWGYLILSQR